VTAKVIDCRHWGPRPWDCDRAANGHPISKLPAGFSALELHAPCVTIVHPDLIRGWNLSSLSAAYTLCMIFKWAPSSYRRFSLCWTNDVALHIRRGIAARPKGSSDDNVLQVASTVLADNMRECAVHLDMSVTVIREAGTNRIDLNRL